MTESTSNISNRAMLVTLKISKWTARKMDKKTSQRIASESGIDPKRGSYYKTLVGGDTIEAIKRKGNDLRAYHYMMTLPWSDEGPRILPADAYFEYMSHMQEERQKFDELVRQFVQEYPYAREEAKRMLGSLFDPEDYPSTEDVAQKFGVDIQVHPLPAADDFRVDIADEEVARIQKDIEDRTNATLQSSMEAVYERIKEVLDKFEDRLAEEDTVFRNSLVGNARELVGLLPKFNLTGDPKLDEMARRMDEGLCKYTPDQLRNNSSARIETYNSAREMKSELLDFFGGQMQ
jgi:hypothetical protein